MERLLQDWTKDETEILEGHTGPPDTTPRTTWDSVVPDGDIGALAATARPTFQYRLKPTHPFRGDYDTAIRNALPGRPQLVHPAKHPSPHPARRPTRVAPCWATSAGVRPVRRCSHRGTQHHQLSADRAATDTGTTHTPQPNKPHKPPQNNSPQRGQSPLAHKGTEPPSATATVQHHAKPLTTGHVRDNYQLPREGNHTRSITTSTARKSSRE